MDERDQYASGMKHRRAMLGDAWGEIWSRRGLDRRHVHGAFNNGLTQDDLKELILQSAVYAGVPAANAAIHRAQEVIAVLSVRSP